MTSVVERPDLLVGVDFGTTFTGVAWTNLRNPTQIIRDWSGQSDALERKVPTKFVYSRDGQVSSWGFSCDDENQLEVGTKVEKWFKIYIDPESIDAEQRFGMDTPQTPETAKTMITDYLHQIYEHIKTSITGTGQGWDNQKIEFIFSLPTTWTSQETVNDFKDAIRRAGFGANSQLHTFQLELTEAEAAAVYTAQDSQVPFKDGDVLLSCDAGGGTTDLALLKVTGAGNPPVLDQLHHVGGSGIGSTTIDRAFESLVIKRFSQYPDAMSVMPPGVIPMLVHSRAFRDVKHGFGSAAGTQEQYKLRLDDLPRSYNHSGVGIDGGRMVFTYTEIQTLFDIQIDKIISRIDHELDWLDKSGVGTQVRYMVLSGGLGSSSYVHSRLKQRFIDNPHPSARDMTIMRSQEPQLAVVKGLVMDRRQRIESGKAILKTRVARVSYGVLCNVRWNDAIHAGEDSILDTYTGRKFAINQIDWVIRKGDILETNSSKQRPFSQKLNAKDPTREFKTKIVVSHSDHGQLPRSLKSPGASKLCDVISNLSGCKDKEFLEKAKHFWQKGKHHLIAEFTIKVVIAPADIIFELWFKGAKYSRNHEPIKIDWDREGVASRPAAENLRPYSRPIGSRYGGGSASPNSQFGSASPSLPQAGPLPHRQLSTQPMGQNGYNSARLPPSQSEAHPSSPEDSRSELYSAPSNSRYPEGPDGYSPNLQSATSSTNTRFSNPPPGAHFGTMNSPPPLYTTTNYNTSAPYQSYRPPERQNQFHDQIPRAEIDTSQYPPPQISQGIGARTPSVGRKQVGSFGGGPPKWGRQDGQEYYELPPGA